MVRDLMDNIFENHPEWLFRSLEKELKAREAAAAAAKAAANPNNRGAYEKPLKENESAASVVLSTADGKNVNKHALNEAVKVGECMASSIGPVVPAEYGVMIANMPCPQGTQQKKR